MKTGIELISEERQRQISVEGWTQEHDLEHKEGELAIAASVYCNTPSGRNKFLGIDDVPLQWPWERSWWKPTPEDRIRELQKAGALIAAEIDRLQQI